MRTASKEAKPLAAAVKPRNADHGSCQQRRHGLATNHTSTHHRRSDTLIGNAPVARDAISAALLRCSAVEDAVIGFEYLMEGDRIGVEIGAGSRLQQEMPVRILAAH